MLEITWFRGKFKDGEFFIYESHCKKIDYFSKLDRDEVYEVFDMILDFIREGYFVHLNAI